MLSIYDVLRNIVYCEKAGVTPTRYALARSLHVSHHRVSPICDLLEELLLVTVHEYNHRPNVKAKSYKLNIFGERVVAAIDNAAEQKPLPF